MLESSNPLIYEGAINALSCLEDVALEGLLAALNVKGYREEVESPEGVQIGSFTSRIERAILGMMHFPGERLLDVLALWE